MEPYKLDTRRAGEGFSSTPLEFDELRVQNLLRCEESFHLLDSWSVNDWATALGGETGEALNFCKKLRRLDDAGNIKETDQDRKEIVDNIMKELADIVIYADLLSARLGRDLGNAVILKFNEVSELRCSTRKL